MSYAVRNDGQGFRAVLSPEDIGSDEWYSEDTPPDPVPLPPTKDELVALANAEKDRRISLSAIRISPLQDAVDLGVATEAESDSLVAWKKYRVALNRVSDQVKYPEEIEWPQTPDNK